ncbi:MAG: hypothetical protein J6K25_15225 [Thermoguttaceae bacterium]|nr:hypothetical protein [Thermoguttaceae bacterium]
MNDILPLAAAFFVGGLFGAVVASARRRRFVFALRERVEASERASARFAVELFKLENALNAAEAKILKLANATNATEAR